MEKFLVFFLMILFKVVFLMFLSCFILFFPWFWGFSKHNTNTFLATIGGGGGARSFWAAELAAISWNYELPARLILIYSVICNYWLKIITQEAHVVLDRNSAIWRIEIYNSTNLKILKIHLFKSAVLKIRAFADCAILRF